MLNFKWEEGGQTEVSPPSKTGFGTRLIDMNVTRELGGRINRDYRPDGLKIEIEFPLA
jgi:two-component sensor histidine kinase